MEASQPAVSGVLAGSAWGWHIETAIHVIRMILGGVFDRHPGLTGDHGPYGRGHAVYAAEDGPDVAGDHRTRRPLSDYLRENVHYTFSGFNFPPTFLDLLLEVGVDRITFSVDYP